MNPVEYWNTREKEQGRHYCNYSGYTADENNNLVDVRREFFRSHIPEVFEMHTLDFGCGPCQYEDLWNPEPERWIGCDIIENLPGYFKGGKRNYVLLSEPRITETEREIIEEYIGVCIECVFTSTVLQHNPLDIVDKIIKSFSTHLEPYTLVFYEATGPVRTTGHTWTRPVSEYQRIVSKHFDSYSFFSVSHTVHGQEHTLMRFEIDG